MPGWLPKALTRIRALAAARKVLFTLKARRELASSELGLDEEDACDVLTKLTAEEAVGRLESATTGEWMYLFKPLLAGTVLYVKLIVRGDCVIVVSFHEDEGGGHEEKRRSTRVVRPSPGPRSSRRRLSRVRYPHEGDTGHGCSFPVNGERVAGANPSPLVPEV